MCAGGKADQSLKSLFWVLAAAAPVSVLAVFLVALTDTRSELVAVVFPPPAGLAQSYRVVAESGGAVVNDYFGGLVVLARAGSDVAQFSRNVRSLGAVSVFGVAGPAGCSATGPRY